LPAWRACTARARAQPRGRTPARQLSPADPQPRGAGCAGGPSIIAQADTDVRILEHPGVPGTPSGVSAKAGDHAAAVSFAAPGYDGGESVYAYTVTASPGGAKASGATSPIRITGLTNGKAYTFSRSPRLTSGAPGGLLRPPGP
jgi:hypothetical protein